MAGLVAAALCVAGSVPADAKPSSSSIVRSTGDLAATTARPATGTFELIEKIKIDGREKPGYVIEASGLDASRGDNGRRVEHGAFLITVGGTEIFLGSLNVNGKGEGRLQKRNATKILGPQGTPLREQEGATIEVRGPLGTVLRGTAPAFELDDAGKFTDRRETFGRFVRISGSAPTGTPGSFAFRTDEHSSGEIRNRAVIQSNSLLKGSTYTVWLFGPRTVSLGNMENHPNKGATLSLDSRRAPIPGNIVRWSEFDGGTVEIRRGGTVFFRGSITIFRSASERVEDAGWARSRSTVELVATASGGDARALLTASVLTRPHSREQEIRVRAFDLDKNAGPYVVATVEPDGVRHELGTFDVRGKATAGGFRLTTRRGDRTPPGGVLGQAGRPVEVTDAGGTVVLTGTFPTLD
jgi:hypothetical protein